MHKINLNPGGQFPPQDPFRDVNVTIFDNNQFEMIQKVINNQTAYFQSLLAQQEEKFNQKIEDERNLRQREMNSFFSIGGAGFGMLGAVTYRWLQGGSLPSLLRAAGTGSVAGSLGGLALSLLKNRQENSEFPFNRR